MGAGVHLRPPSTAKEPKGREHPRFENGKYACLSASMATSSPQTQGSCPALRSAWMVLFLNYYPHGFVMLIRPHLVALPRGYNSSPLLGSIATGLKIAAYIPPHIPWVMLGGQLL